ncbi:MAG: hypothetical protein NBV67_06410 [Tagaea sp.]|nr:hypothetical protein [Tagaea sp.]
MRPLDPGHDRVVDFQASAPEAIWADLARDDDRAAARELGRAMIGIVTGSVAGRIAWRVVPRLLRATGRTRHPRYGAESDHLAREFFAADADPAQVAFLQAQYSFSKAIASACTSSVAWDEERGSMRHFRSLDWRSTAEIARATRRKGFRRADGTTAFRCAGIAGMVGLLTAVGRGFSIAINSAPWGWFGIGRGDDPTYLLRDLMQDDAVDSFAAAYAAIEKLRPAAPVFLTLCGVGPEEGAAFEFGFGADGKIACRAVAMPKRGFLVRTNHFDADSPFASRNVGQALDPATDWESRTLMATSRRRRDMVEAALAQAQGRDLDAVFARVHAQAPVWNRQTAQWVAMRPATDDIEIRVRA